MRPDTHPRAPRVSAGTVVPGRVTNQAHHDHTMWPGRENGSQERAESSEGCPLPFGLRVRLAAKVIPSAQSQRLRQLP
jgi:hypothetical protein